MIKRLSATENMLFISVGFTMLLLAARNILTKELAYGFYFWNTFLAIVPFLFSQKLSKQNKLSVKAILLIAGWILFFPNAPYLITDIIHFNNSGTHIKWLDVVLIISASWNGLILAIVSLMNIEKFLSRHLKPVLTKAFVFLSFGLCGYGIYLGRILRFNSWDIFVDANHLFSTSFNHFLHPVHNRYIWEFSLVIASFMLIIYYTIRQLTSEENLKMR
jgi:uncharacterized membrane protein